jgi:hypothetical protein
VAESSAAHPVPAYCSRGAQLKSVTTAGSFVEHPAARTVADVLGVSPRFPAE